MADESEGDNGKILRMRMLTWMQEELEIEDDQGLALRKALLAAIFVASTKEPAIARYADYLLTQFGPLVDHFDDDLHPFLAEHDILRFAKPDQAELMVHQSLLDAIMEDEVTGEDILASGLRLPWEVIAERFVACFEIVNPESLIGGRQEDIEDLTDILHNAVACVEDFGPWKDEPEGPLHYPGCWLRSAHLSNRIFLFTRDASSKSHIIILLAAQRLFTEATEIGIGLRGSIALGECIADSDKAVYFGEPLIEAEQLAKEQAWFGVAFHPSMDETGINDNPAPENVEGWIPMSDLYEIPLADGETGDLMGALNWAMLFRDDPEGLDAFLEPLCREDDPRLYAYYRETQQFGHEMIHRMQTGGVRPTLLN